MYPKLVNMGKRAHGSVVFDRRAQFFSVPSQPCAHPSESRPLTHAFLSYDDQIEECRGYASARRGLCNIFHISLSWIGRACMRLHMDSNIVTRLLINGTIRAR